MALSSYPISDVIKRLVLPMAIVSSALLTNLSAQQAPKAPKKTEPSTTQSTPQTTPRNIPVVGESMRVKMTVKIVNGDIIYDQVAITPDTTSSAPKQTPASTLPKTPNPPKTSPK